MANNLFKKRLQRSIVLTGATSPDSIISTAEGESICIYSITVNVNALLDVPSIMSLWSEAVLTQDILSVPLDTTKMIGQFVYFPQTALLLDVFRDFKLEWSAAATITGNIIIDVDYEIFSL